ncbi:MAG: Maf family protein, partial [Firmicutes bacterium]|nr:Maf family protein [Bacillota bacterium]
MSKTVNSLADIPVILASGSPRRIKMLRDLGIDPVIIRPECGETLHMELTPAQTVMALSLRKALSVAATLEEGCPADDWLLIASDTVVSFEGRILGKP